MTKKHILIEFLPRTLWVTIGIVLFLIEYFNATPAALTQDRATLLTGVVFTVVGLAYLIWSGWYILKPMFTKELVIDGPYRLARHPVYVAMYIALTGLGLLLFSWAWFVILLAAIPLWYLVCRAEEKQMTDLYDHEYEEYKKRVGMFLPKSTKVSRAIALIILCVMVAGIYLKMPTAGLIPKSPPVLYLGVMIHLEGWDNEINSQDMFQGHAQATRELATVLEKYGAKGTFEARPEFVLGSNNWNDNVMAELVERGHGVGVHADVGGRADELGLTQEEMTTELTKMRKEFRLKTGIEARHASGVCSSLDWVQVTVQAGFEFMTGGVAYCAMSLPTEDRPEEYRDCPTPSKCHDVFPSEISERIHPWRTSSGDNWLEDDPEGELVILASDEVLFGYDGEHDNMSQADAEAGILALEEALAHVKEGQVNMMYVAWSLGDPDKVSSPALEEWLQAVEPYVEAGLVQWATLPEIHDLYVGENIDTSSEEESPWGRSGPEDTALIYSDLEYAVVDNVSLELDLYRPSGYGYDVPVIVWVHGGAWTGGDKADVDSLCERLALAGYAVASINYRFSHQAIFPAQIHDVKAAVRWLRTQADEYDLDPDQIGVIGSSAGGHLAALLGTSGGVQELEGAVGEHTNESSLVQAVVDMYGPVNFETLGADCQDSCRMDHDGAQSPESKLIGCALPACLNKAQAASPITYVSSDDPPFLVLHGSEDPTIPIGQSEQFVITLDNVGVTAELVVAKGFGHDRGMFWEYTNQIISFFDEHLK